MSPQIRSYSQYKQDLYVWKYLRSVSNGFYVDVGAYHPVNLSDTKFFYDQGWSGINIDPVTEHIANLRNARKRDINVLTAISNHIGNMTLYKSGTGSTLVKKYARNGPRGRSTPITVPVTTLTEIAHQYIPEGQDVHFCKIDIEGHEKEAIEGIDFSVFRPWLFQIESKAPDGSNAPTYPGWEPILLQNGYIFAEKAGIDRLYVDTSRPNLVDIAKGRPSAPQIPATPPAAPPAPSSPPRGGSTRKPPPRRQPVRSTRPSPR